MAKGTIRRLLKHRSFGFIQSEDGRDVFFHRSAVGDILFKGLQEGQTVEFVVEETPQGPKARDVRVMMEDHSAPLGTSQ